MSWNNLIGFVISGKAIGIRLGNVSVQSRVYPSERDHSTVSDHAPTTPKNSRRHLVSTATKFVSKIEAAQIQLQLQFFNSEFDQSETTWEIALSNICLEIDEVDSLAVYRLAVENIRPSISHPKAHLFKVDFPLTIMYKYSVTSTPGKFDALRYLDISVPRLRMESEVKVLGVIAKVLQKDHQNRPNDSAYSSKTKLIYSNLLG